MGSYALIRGDSKDKVETALHDLRMYTLQDTLQRLIRKMQTIL